MNTHKKLLSVAFLSIGLLPTGTSYALHNVDALVSNAGEAAKDSFASDMAKHQQEMEALYKKLQTSYAEVRKGQKDDKAWFKTPPELKTAISAHDANLKELRTAVREQKLFSEDYKAMCPSNPEAVKEMAEHQVVMKSVLYDLVDSFDRVLTMRDDVNYNMLGEALTDHREAMDRFEQAIEQHKQDIAKYAQSCQ